LAVAVLLTAAPASADLELAQPWFRKVLVTDQLPVGALNPLPATDGYVYLLVELGGVGDTGPNDNSLFRVDLGTGAIANQGKIALTNPTTSNLLQLAQGPGGSLTSKLYVVDWVSGAPARIDRFNPDLSGHEVIFANTDGIPVDTPTSTIAFSTSLEYLEAGYFAGQGSSLPGAIWRFGIVPGLDPFLWADPAGSADIRGIAFAPGGTFGTDMYVAQSTVTNGFNDAPGEIRRILSDGVGNYGGETVLVSEASGLLEFGREIVFDTGGLFGGDLLYLQSDSQLLRVTATGEVSLFATDVRFMAIHPPTGELLVVSGTRLYRVLPVNIPALRPASLMLAFACLLLVGVAIVPRAMKHLS
jgi:hypothetical protein